MSVSDSGGTGYAVLASVVAGGDARARHLQSAAGTPGVGFRVLLGDVNVVVPVLVVEVAAQFVASANLGRAVEDGAVHLCLGGWPVDGALIGGLDVDLGRDGCPVDLWLNPMLGPSVLGEGAGSQVFVALWTRHAAALALSVGVALAGVAPSWSRSYLFWTG